MSFLGDLFSNAWEGLSGGVKAVGRGVDDLAHGDFNSAENEGENSFRELSRIPATPFSTLRGLYLGAKGDLDWNPYSKNNSVWDQAAGGGASEDPRNRAIGRTIGTAIGSYFTGGALGSAMNSSAGGAAASGALWGAGKTAGEGGNSTEIAQGAMRGGGAGLIGNYTAGLDLAGSAGITDSTYRGIVNGAIGGATSAAATPGSDSKDVARGGLFGGISGGLQSTGGNGGNMDYSENGYSRAPWAGGTQDNSMFVDNTGPQSMPTNYNPNTSPFSSYSAPAAKEQNPFSDYIDRALGFFKQPDGSWNGQRLDQTVNGLMGLYGGYQRKRAADQFMRGMSGRRNAYEENMRNELARKDAAAGRRSAYDTRAVELNSRLAALDAQQAPALMNAQNSSLAGMFNMLQSGYGMARNYGAFDTPMQTQNFQLQPLQLQQPYQMQNEMTPDNFSLAGYTPRLKNKGYVGDY